MNSGQKAHPFVAWLLMLALGTMLSADSAPRLSRIDVAYLGRISPEVDMPYQYFAAALQGMPVALRSRLRVRFIAAMTTDSWRFDAAALEALQMRPAAIIAPNTAAARAFRRHHAAMPPVVFASFMDPVLYGVVASTSPRAEPITGIWITDDLDAKRLELLQDAYPGIKKVAVLMDKDWAKNSDAAARLAGAGTQLGLQVTLLFAEDAEEATRVLDGLAPDDFDAWLLPPTGLAYLSSEPLLARLRTWRKPVITGSTGDVTAGAPLSYTVDDSFRFAAMVDLLRRVLEGEPPGAIPIQRPPPPKLAVNATPRDGFPMPAPGILKRADIVVAR
ncbi:ABC transporter substrate binding protein [Roseateles asaccharophilus]|uniref:ABC-type uncharacterized transport system substrate-binding protein n=1 Tax=Roseateles asaccharophilus TaxID=582607 RepID=A0ABU2AAA5_9BURK|nr:ABC transporter substrate binding protein [Roseateles asaccharophilus]MDR7332958.1 ABC-type uncharacterized transport system substrate-binding protein [Roseateles asaccharophilus]